MRHLRGVCEVKLHTVHFISYSGWSQAPLGKTASWAYSPSPFPSPSLPPWYIFSMSSLPVSQTSLDELLGKRSCGIMSNQGKIPNPRL